MQVCKLTPKYAKFFSHQGRKIHTGVTMKQTLMEAYREGLAARKLAQGNLTPSTARASQQSKVPVKTPFLAKHLPEPARDVFPDWEGLLVQSAVLDMCVWAVRTRQEGEELARETGHPALLLDDVLMQKGKTPVETQAALLPILIMGTMQ